MTKKPLIRRGIEEAFNGFSAAGRSLGIELIEYDVMNHILYFNGDGALSDETRSCVQNVPDSVIATGIIAKESEEAYYQIFKDIEAGNLRTSRVIWANSQQNGKKCYHVAFSTVMENDKPVYAYGFAHDITDTVNEKMQISSKYNEDIQEIQKQANEAISSFRFNITKNSLEFFSGRMLDEKTTIGLSIEDHLNEIVKTIVLPSDQKEFLNTFCRENLILCFENGIYKICRDYLIVNFEGNEGWVEFSVTLRRHPESNDLMCFVMELNITKEKLVHEALRIIADEELITVIRVNPNTGKYLFCTDNKSAIIPDTGDYEDESYVLISHFNSKEETPVEMAKKISLKTITAELKENKVYIVTSRVYDKNGQEKRILTEFSYIDDHKREIIVIQKNITKMFLVEERRQKQLDKALAEIEKANMSKDNIISTISHDMRTPLNGVIGYADLALEVNDIDLIKSYIQKLKTSGELLLQLINDILAMSKINSGTTTLISKAVWPKDLVAEIINNVRSSALEKLISLNVDIQGIKDVNIVADKLRTEQILLNLLTNAIKFTPIKGQVEFRVRYLCSPVKNCNWQFTVADNGIGMSEDFQKIMFEPFTQENRLRNELNKTGTGLGLSIVKNLVELMGGFIEVNSVIDKGTRFDVYLPFNEAGQQRYVEAANNIDYSYLALKKVLLCEDHPINVEIIKLLLEKKKIIVYVAENGKIGLEMFKNSKPFYYDAILMDIKMPVLDGVEATKQIRELDREDAKSIPILALTANAFDEERNESLKAGMNAHLTKPINQVVLYQALIEYIYEYEKIKEGL